MKKIFIALICILCLVPGGVMASGSTLDSGFMPLIEHIVQIEVTDFESEITIDEANSIIKAMLGEKPFKSDAILNCDLVKFLASKCQSDVKVSVKYKDMGLVKPEYRKDYSVLAGAGKLYSEDGYVYPNNPLTYGMLTGSLAYFEDDILSHCGIKAMQGEVSQVYAEGGRTYIDVYSDNVKSKVSTRDISSVTVYKDGTSTPYSRNITRGDNMTFYIDDKGELIYARQNESKISVSENFNSKYTLYKANLYYLEGDMLITNNAYIYNGTDYTPTGDRYNEFVITENTYIKENFNIIDKSVINRWLLDQNSYIICNKEGEVLYINVCK